MQVENIKTLSFGCRLNALEAEKIQSILAPALAAAIVVNTCAVTAEAERQSAQTIRKLARENPDAPIFITGCAATRNPELFDEIDNAIVIDNRDKMRLGAYIQALSISPCYKTEHTIQKFNHQNAKLSKQFIQIQNGCNHMCAYCVTRLLRGKNVAFAYSDILNETRTAVANGYFEIVLTGVDIASYVGTDDNVPMLISDLCRKLLNDVPEIQRLRLSSMDPASPEIPKVIELMTQDARMLTHMHLSMQSGSDTVLRAMRRRHTADLVRAFVSGRKDAIGITFSWDIICGFPGETAELFQETVALARELAPIKIHAFPFSPRPGTEAADMSGQIPRAESKRRVKIISDVADANKHELMRRQLNTTTQVLVEEKNVARTPDDIAVQIVGTPIPSKTVCNINLTEIKDDFFIGYQVA